MVTTEAGVLLWGGLGGSASGGTYLRDTWLQADGVWTQIASATSPQGYRASGAWDSGRNVVVSFGGGTEKGFSNQLHEFDVERRIWREREPEGERPEPRLGPAMAYIPGWGCLLTGGTMGGEETWRWDGEAWERIAVPGPEPVYNHSLVWDPVRERAVQFGGLHGMEAVNSTWEFDPAENRWTRANPKASPPARLLHSFAYVPGRGVVIGYGMADLRNTAYLGDMWAWDGEDWQPVAAAQEAGNRFCAQVCWLPGRGLLLFGGEAHAGSATETVRLGDSLLLLPASIDAATVSVDAATVGAEAKTAR